MGKLTNNNVHLIDNTQNERETQFFTYNYVVCKNTTYIVSLGIMWVPRWSFAQSNFN
jgi:hypothetical protein